MNTDFILINYSHYTSLY